MSERWVDVSHEALIRGWPRLRRWIEEDRAGLRVHRRLTEAALEWDKMGRDNSLLYRGARLAQAAEWRQANEASLNDLERAFLDAGAALERSEIEARERLRRRIIGGLSVALAIFVVLTVVAFLQWRQSNLRGQIALARQLAAQADLLRDQPMMLSRRLALATEAMQRLHAVGAHSLEVDATLRRDLALSPRHIARFPVKVQGEVYDVQLSPDGRFVIGGNYTEGSASVWEIATRKELVHIETDVREVTATRLGQEPIRIQTEGPGGSSQIKALSPEGKVLVTVNGDGHVDAVQVWEVATGRELLPLKLSGRNHYVLSDDGRYLAVSILIPQSSAAIITRVWSVKTRREIPGSVPGYVRDFSQDGRYMATSVGLWEVAGELKERFAWPTQLFKHIEISSDGGNVAIPYGGIWVWSTATGPYHPPPPGPTEVAGALLALAPNGKFVILYSGGDHTIQVLNVATRAIVSRTSLFGRSAVVTPSGQKLIATVSVDGDAVDVWELRPEGGPVITVDHSGDVVTVGLTPLERLTTIVRNGESLTARTWDIETGQEKPDLAMDLAGNGAAFAPDGASFAVVSESGLEVRKVGDLQPVTKLAYGGVRKMEWSPDGRYLAAATEKEARVWDLSNRSSVVGQIKLPGPPTELALARGGDSLAAVVGSGEVTRSGEVHTAMLWRNVSSDEEPISFEPDKGESIREDTHCALDTRYLITRDLEVLDMKSGASVSRLGLNERAGTGCVLSPDERYLAISLSNGIRIWEVESGKKVFQMTIQDRPLAFDQESRYLATISPENTVRVWPLRQTDLIAEACRRLPRNLSKEEWSLYVEGEAYRKTCPKLP